MVERLPAGFRLTPEALFLPDQMEIGFGGQRTDNQFAKIFRTSCRQSPTDDELTAVNNYKVNAFLSGSGGSLQAARTMMQAASAIVWAGGEGGVIDNCGLAHGGQNWLEMTDDGSSDALSFAFVAIIRGKADVWTMGMHVLGLRDIVMKRADVEEGGLDIIEVIRYLARGEKPADDGHVLTDLNGPPFRVFQQDSPADFAGSPMHNPYRRLKLASTRDIAETN